MERHFASWGDGGREIDVQRLDRSPAGLAAYRALPRPADASSRTSTARGALGVGAGPVPRGALRRGPAARPRADRGRLREGLPPRARACCTRTTTRRSQFFRRYFDEFRSLREVLGPSSRGARANAAGRPRARGRATSAGCSEQGVQRPRRSCGRSRSRAATTRSAWRARSSARAPTALPAPLRRALSLEGRDTLHALRGARRARCSSAATSGAAVEPDDWAWEFVRASLPAPADRARAARRRRRRAR